jgi:hypothetical protein
MDSIVHGLSWVLKSQYGSDHSMYATSTHSIVCWVVVFWVLTVVSEGLITTNFTPLILLYRFASASNCDTKFQFLNFFTMSYYHLAQRAEDHANYNSVMIFVLYKNWYPGNHSEVMINWQFTYTENGMSNRYFAQLKIIFKYEILPLYITSWYFKILQFHDVEAFLRS